MNIYMLNMKEHLEMELFTKVDSRQNYYFRKLK